MKKKYYIILAFLLIVIIWQFPVIFMNIAGTKIGDIIISEILTSFYYKKSFIEIINKVGIKDKNNKIIIPAKYDNIIFCNNPHFFIIKDGIYTGVINDKNIIIIPFEYKNIRSLKNNEFLVSKYPNTSKLNNYNNAFCKNIQLIRQKALCKLNQNYWYETYGGDFFGKYGSVINSSGKYIYKDQFFDDEEKSKLYDYYIKNKLEIKQSNQNYIIFNNKNPINLFK